MNAKQYIRYETPDVICEMTLSVAVKDSAHTITQMPSGEALALANALRIKYSGNMDAVWAELDRLALEVMGYPLSQKFKGAKIDF